MLVWRYFDLIHSGVVPVIPKEYDPNKDLIPDELQSLLYFENFDEIVERMDLIKSNINDIVSVMRKYISDNKVNFKKDRNYIKIEDFIRGV
jgi:hypothetical protein